MSACKEAIMKVRKMACLPAALEAILDAAVRADEQHQGEPVAYMLTPPGCVAALVHAVDLTYRSEHAVPLYTRADPAEVERLRDQLAAWQALAAERLEVATGLRAQLAERDALVGAIAGWTTETRAAVLEAFQDELHESASYAWYDAAIVDLMKLVEALSASAEPSAPVELKAPELTEDLREILGRPNFTCHFIAKALRVMGHSIAHKSEDEQAAVIHWLLGIYLKHGSDWRQRAVAELEEASQSLNT